MSTICSNIPQNLGRNEQFSLLSCKNAGRALSGSRMIRQHLPERIVGEAALGLPAFWTLFPEVSAKRPTNINIIVDIGAEAWYN